MALVKWFVFLFVQSMWMRLLQAQLPTGYNGCYIDVLHLLHSACSGKTECTYDVMNRDLQKLTPCVEGLTSYLEASFECIEVAMAEKDVCSSHRIHKLLSTSGYLSSLVAKQKRCGAMRSPWRIEAQPGQTVNITLIDFSSNKSNQLDKNNCKAIGYITDSTMKSNVTICSTGSSQQSVYSSHGHSVDVQMITSNEDRQVTDNLGPKMASGEFLLKYQVFGCPDIHPPEFTWYEREGASAVVGCEHSKKTWTLRCEGSRWIGVVGNCTGNDIPVRSEQVSGWLTMPNRMTIVVLVSLALGITLIVAGCGFVCVMKRQRSTQHPPPQIHYTTTLEREAGQWTRSYPRQQGTLANNRTYRRDDFQHIWETPLPEPFNKQLPPAYPVDATCDQDFDANGSTDGDFEGSGRDGPKYYVLDKDLVRRDLM